MGVNDLNIVDTVNSRAVEYFKLYKSLANKYENVEFYFMSVNPVQARYMYTKDMADMRNDEIMRFNAAMHKLLEKNDLDNMHYCDSYNNIHFETYDGLHYDNSTNQLILNYITNKCVIYNTKRTI